MACKRSSVRLRYTPPKRVAQRPFFDKARGSSSSGRAFGSQSKGSGFESHLLHKKGRVRWRSPFLRSRWSQRCRVVGRADGAPRVPSTPQRRQRAPPNGGARCLLLAVPSKGQRPAKMVAMLPTKSFTAMASRMTPKNLRST